MFLGAGGVGPVRTRLPVFDALATAVLRGLGWTPHEQGDGKGKAMDAPVLSRLSHALVGARGAFRHLAPIGIEFANQVAAAPDDFGTERRAQRGCRSPGSQGCCLDHQYRQRGRAGLPRARHRGHGCGASRQWCSEAAAPFARLRTRVAGQVPRDRRGPEHPRLHRPGLIAPLADDDARHLAGIGSGKTIVLYGYAGADPDLYGLLDSVARASRVIWFEPSQQRRDEIERAFPKSDLEFRLDYRAKQAAAAREATGAAFLELAGRPARRLIRPLPPPSSTRPRGRPHWSHSRSPNTGVTQARIVRTVRGSPGR